MPWQGETFVRFDGVRKGPTVWTSARAATRLIEDADHDVHDEDLVQGFVECIRRGGANGTTTPTGNLPMGTNRFLGVGAGAARNEYSTAAQLQGNDLRFDGVAGGTVNAVTITVSPAITSIADGMTVSWKATGANTGPVTLNVNGTGANPVVKKGTALGAGDILADDIVIVLYNGAVTAWEIIGFHRLPLFSGSGIQPAAIADGAISAVKLIDGSIANAKLADAVVATAKIANVSVLQDNLDPAIGDLAVVDYTRFTSSQNYAKPPGARWYFGHMVGAGGSGGTAFYNARGAGGGGGLLFLLPAEWIPASAAIVIGAGGTVEGQNGGNSSIALTSGRVITAGGGGYGQSSTTGGSGGGKGGAEESQGGPTTTGGDPGWGNYWAGGRGAQATNFTNTTPADPGHFGGGGGGAGSNDPGAGSIYGAGGGGARNPPGPGGVSIFAGNGGAGDANGAAPGGGGGGFGDGARGQLDLWVLR